MFLWGFPPFLLLICQDSPRSTGLPPPGPSAQQPWQQYTQSYGPEQVPFHTNPVTSPKQFNTRKAGCTHLAIYGLAGLQPLKTTNKTISFPVINVLIFVAFGFQRLQLMLARLLKCFHHTSNIKPTFTFQFSAVY